MDKLRRNQRSLALVVKLLISSGALMAKGTFAAGFCPALFSLPEPVRFGFDLESAAIDPREEHTIPRDDLLSYAKRQLGDAFNLVRDENVYFYVLQGSVSSAKAVARALNCGFDRPVAHEEGFHSIFEICPSAKSKAVAIARVNTPERLTHIHALLKLSGLPAHRLVTVGREFSWKDDFRRSLLSASPRPDFVFYGFPNSIADALVRMTPQGRLLEPKIAKAYRLKNRRVRFDDHELSNLWVLKVTLLDGRTIWLLPSLFGEMAKDLFSALSEIGPERVVYFGTSGNLTGHRQVGDFFSPLFLFEQGRFESLSWMKEIRGIPQSGRYIKVPTYLVETESWRRYFAALGVTDVEVELGYALQIFADTKTRFSAVLVTSDVLHGPGHAPISGQSYSFFENLVPKLKDIVKRELFVNESAVSPVVQMEAIPLGHKSQEGGVL